MQLKRVLGIIDVFSIATGAMISSGIFILPGFAHARAGPAVVVSYLLAALLASTGMLSQAELVSAMPRAGGTYFYVTRSMGPAMGAVDGLITWFSLTLKSSFALVGMAAFTCLIVDIDVHIVAVFFCLLFVIINIIGIKEAGRCQVGLVAGLLVLMVLYVVRGLPSVDINNFSPFSPNGLAGVFSTTGLVFVSYGGLLKVASVAEEVKEPGRVIPLGMIVSLLVVSILYALVVFVTSGVLGSAELDYSLTPISDGAAVFMGTGGRIALSLAAVLAFVSTANAGIMAASRYPVALSRDGLLPGVLGNINDRFKTPHVAVLVTGLFIIMALFLKLEVLVKAASSVLILTFVFSCLSVIIMRESHLRNYQPRFRCPFYPWIQIVGVTGFTFLLLEMGTETFLACSVLVAGGLFLYWFYGRIRTNREYALLHLIERVTARELVTGSLENELKEIIRERDNIIKDRFDHITEECTVLDIESSLSVEKFFKLVADSISTSDIGRDILPPVLFESLLRREKEGSTVLAPGLAIPHVVMPGEHMFDILLARCREGICFTGDQPPVHAVFVLIGTRDERNFHLRVLSAIAQLALEPHFERKWMQAKGIEALRDIVLLGERKRGQLVSTRREP